MAETSDKISAIAGELANITPDELAARAANPASCAKLAQNIRSMAASLLRQDETKGLRGFFKRVIG